MLLGKKEFLAGFLAAAIVGGAAFEPVSILALAKNTLSPEVAFSRQLGLFDTQELNSKDLNGNISEAAFQTSLSRVLVETGVLKSYDRQELLFNGIIDPEQPAKTISRREACETVLRTIMFAWIQDSLPRPEEVSLGGSFRDWQPDSKYGPALDYAMQAGVVQGGLDGKFRPDDRLKLKEAIWFLKRLHDLLSANGSAHRFALFADVPQDHYMTRPLLNLRNAGAFDQTNLGRRLNGNGGITVGDLGLLMQGILARQDKPVHLTEIKLMVKQSGRNRAASRSLLARMVAVLTHATPHSETDQLILYSDVKDGSREAAALMTLAKAGVRLGYNNNVFAGNEQVSRFEALGVINRVISELEPVPEPEQLKLENPRSATSSDMQDFINRLRSKRERVRRILNRKH